MICFITNCQLSGYGARCLRGNDGRFYRAGTGIDETLADAKTRRGSKNAEIRLYKRFSYGYNG